MDTPLAEIPGLDRHLPATKRHGDTLSLSLRRTRQVQPERPVSPDHLGCREQPTVSTIDLFHRVVYRLPRLAAVLHGRFPFPQTNVFDANDNNVGFTDHQDVAQFLVEFGPRIVVAPKGKERSTANAKNKFFATVDGQTLLRHTLKIVTGCRLRKGCFLGGFSAA